MNADDLLDYHLGQIEPSRRGPLEARLAADPELAGFSSRVSTALSQLLDDGRADDLEPPGDLADRTASRVRDRQDRPRVLELTPVRVPFRWADVAVAAGIFLAGLATLLPAVQRTRATYQQAGCTYNLQQLGLGLASYVNNHDAYPHPPQGHPAGYFLVQLQEIGELSDSSVNVCPCRSARIEGLPPCSEFDRMMADSPDACQRMLAEGYAYNAGCRVGGSTGPVPKDVARSMPVPLLADGPPVDGHRRVLDGNSPNHGGGGQNVLFSDHSVRWLRTRYYRLREGGADPDIYLNKEGHPAPGLHERDFALLPAAFRVH